MPRVDDGYVAGGGGLRIPGLYGALLVRERGRQERADRATEHMRERFGYSSRRNRRLLDALEAGQTVVMPRWLVGHKRSTPRVDLPWDRQEVTAVTVSPDDVVRPAEGPCSWPGGAADEYIRQGRGES
jgi:hypothetical protein